jgi:hypothetical protein
MKAYGGSEGKAQPFLTSALDGDEWSASGPCRFAPGNPSDRRLGGPQRRSGCCGENKNFLPLSGIELRPSNP